jgi:outer membrane receptor protein involved in Fe transport
MFTNANAQTPLSTIKGTLLDATTHKPIEFTTITLLTSKDSVLVKGVLSDTLGQFVFTNVATGNYVLVYSSVEYTKTKQAIEINDSRSTVDLGKIELAQATQLLGEITVSTQRLAFQPTAEGVTINLNNNLFKTSNNVVDVLRKSPSLQVNDDGSLIMRNAITPKVLINGRDIPMSKEELRNYLSTLKPDEVESIEVITNPSAKYDAEYKGVVNIRLKRDKELGLTGSVSTNFQQHKYASSSNNLNLVYKTQKVAYTARGGYSSVSYFEDATTNQTLINGNKLFTGLFVPNRNNSLDYMFGVDYYLTKKQIIGGQFRVFQNKLDSPYTFDIKLSDSEKVIQHIVSTSDVKTENNNYTGNVYYEGNFKAGTLSFASSIVKYKNDQSQLIQNKSEETIENIRGNFINDTRIVSAQLDYRPAFPKGKLDVGLKMAITDIDNDSKYQNSLNNTWVNDAVNSNKFLYSERNLAAYVSYANTFKKASYMVGLRAENTETEGNSITLNDITKRNYTKWLPSLSVNIPINDNNNLSLSYSKRLSRPSFSALNPYVYIGGPYSSYRGNQYLIPITNHAYSFSYYFRKVSFTANLGVNYDDIQQVPHYDPTNNKTVYRYENLASNKYRGVEIGLPITVNKWWTMQYNLKYYENDYALIFDLPYYQGTVNTKIQYGSISNYHAFKLPQGYNLSLTGHWETGGGTAMFDLKPKGYINIGLQKTLFKTLNTTLNVNDIFRTYVVNATSNRPDIINLVNTNKFGSRYVSLQISYAFGKSTYNAKQVKNSAQEEENRAKR